MTPEPLTEEEREALLKVLLLKVLSVWESEPAFEDSASPEVAVDFVQRCIAAVPRLAAPSGREVGEREARHTATSEADAAKVAETLFDYYGDEAKIEVCRKLTSDPTDEQVWSVLCTRWPAPSAAREDSDGK